ncbi:TPM domain-containing protein [Campylobacter sp. JMF_04 NA10]|uniref:TPM domain-containing protein n=1 Tax=Campylobacter sp. JMF_04 NA10 TaxID=2983824 RepID=UPI0022E9977F|nr:TPM domain-containing protein [Campylobacter sp. JMF_04 NA10]MDA3076105.1 TPM domain-containing protein [Campylobacter sp. JMF_04 NA10]
MRAIFAIFCLCILAQAKFVLNTGEIITPMLAEKIEILGAETQDKTGVGVYVLATQSLGGASLENYALNFASNLSSPYALLVFAEAEHKVEIYGSPEALVLFDREQILSVGSRGRIIPIIASQKKDLNQTQKIGVYNAALLNGYAEICDQIAASKGVGLENSIGNTNNNFINFLRYIFYATLIFALGSYLYKKGRKNGAK